MSKSLGKSINSQHIKELILQLNSYVVLFYEWGKLWMEKEEVIVDGKFFFKIVFNSTFHVWLSVNVNNVHLFNNC